MTACECDEPIPILPRIPAGLDALPRQLRSFPEVREALLRSLPSKVALSDWQARGERDLGLMWLEMWAYVSDVLAFYDERIANESYLRTAQRRPSLRRHPRRRRPLGTTTMMTMTVITTTIPVRPTAMTVTTIES